MLPKIYPFFGVDDHFCEPSILLNAAQMVKNGDMPLGDVPERWCKDVENITAKLKPTP